MAVPGYGGPLRPSRRDGGPFSNGLGGQMSRDDGRRGPDRGPFYGEASGYEGLPSFRERSEESIYRGQTEENGPRGHTREPARSYEGPGYDGQPEDVGYQQNSGSQRVDDYSAGLFNGGRVNGVGEANVENYYPRNGFIKCT